MTFSSLRQQTELRLLFGCRRQQTEGLVGKGEEAQREHHAVEAAESGHGCLFDPRGGQRLAGCQSLEGSFLAVWTAAIARKDAFCSIFRDLQDLHSFAPLQSRKFSKNFVKILAIFPAKSANFTNFYAISSFFAPNLLKFSRIFMKF